MTKTLYLIFTLFLISAFGLTACGGSSTSSQSSSQDSGSQVQPAEEEVAEVEADPSGDPEVGKELFKGTCSACHGPEGKGIEGLGKNMTTSEFIAGKTDAELLAFVKVGRDPSDPLNTTGVAMPPKGGNPALDDEDLLNIIAFIRTLQK